MHKPSCELLMFGANADMGASVFPTKNDLDDPTVWNRCQFMRATEFFKKYINTDDVVIMKLNCEGSECMIMNDLIESGEIEKLIEVMIDFNIRKVPDVASEESKLLFRLAESGFTRYCLAEDVMIGYSPR